MYQDTSFLLWQRISGILLGVLLCLMTFLHVSALYTLRDLKRKKAELVKLHEEFTQTEAAYTVVRQRSAAAKDMCLMLTQTITTPQKWRDALIRITQSLGKNSFLKTFAYDQGSSTITMQGVTDNSQELMQFLHALNAQDFKPQLNSMAQEKGLKNIEFSITVLLKKGSS